LNESSKKQDNEDGDELCDASKAKKLAPPFSICPHPLCGDVFEAVK
jgi:hypothetical protein